MESEFISNSLSNFFPNKLGDVNKLVIPDYIVNSKSLNIVRNGLDKLWYNEDLRITSVRISNDKKLP